MDHAAYDDNHLDEWHLDEWQELMTDSDELGNSRNTSGQNKKRRRLLRKNRKPSRPANHFGRRTNNREQKANRAEKATVLEGIVPPPELYKPPVNDTSSYSAL